LQLYTLRQRAERDFAGALREAAEAGYDAIELAGLHGEAADSVRRDLDALGLGAFAAHVPWERFEADLDGVLAELSALGCEFAVVPSVPGRLHDVAAAADIAAALNGWAARCAEASLRFAYHNHAFELELGAREGATLLELLLSATDPAVVGFELDAYWAAVAGADPVALLERHAGRVPLLHVKDLAPDGGDAPVGEGVLVWPELLAAADRAGVEWLVVEQDHPRDPAADAATSFRNLTRFTS